MRSLILAFVMCALISPAVHTIVQAWDVFPADPLRNNSGETRVVGEFMELRPDAPDTVALDYLHTGVDIAAPAYAEVYPPLPENAFARRVLVGREQTIIVADDYAGGRWVYFKAGHIIPDTDLPQYFDRDRRLGRLRPGPGAHLHAEIWWSWNLPPSSDPWERDAINPRGWAFREAEWMPDDEEPIIEYVIPSFDGSTYTWLVSAYDPGEPGHDEKRGICIIRISVNNHMVAEIDFLNRPRFGNAHADDFYSCTWSGCGYLYKLQWDAHGDVPPEWRIEVCDCSWNCVYDEGDFPTVQEGVQLTAMVEADELHLHWIAPDAQYWFVEFEVLKSIDDRQLFTPINESPIPVVRGQYEYSYTHRLPREWERLEYVVHGIDRDGEAAPVARHELRNEVPLVSKISVGPVPTSGPVQITLQLAGSDHARVHVYDASGRLVRAIYDERLSAGETVLYWDGTDSSGRKVPSGIYFAKAQLQGANHEELRRVIVLR